MNSQLKKKGAAFSDCIFNEVHPRAFFKIGQIILSTPGPIRIPQCPHILLHSSADTAIKTDQVVTAFKNRLSENNLDLIEANIPHFPPENSKRFFVIAGGTQLADQILACAGKYF